MAGPGVYQGGVRRDPPRFVTAWRKRGSEIREEEIPEQTMVTKLRAVLPGREPDL